MTRPSRIATTRTRQHGAALVMSLIILLILTILGISAMGTSSLEQKMAGNMQEQNRAFQAAEAGLTKAMNTSGMLDLNSSKTNPKVSPSPFDFTQMSAQAQVSSGFIQFSRPKRGSGYGSSFDAANFEQVSTGTSGTGAKAVLHQGIAQIVPKQN